MYVGSMIQAKRKQMLQRLLSWTETGTGAWHHYRDLIELEYWFQ